MVGPWLDGDVAETAERARTVAKLELQRIEQQLAGGMVARLIDARPGEGGRLNGVAFQRQVDEGFVPFTAAQGPKVEGLRVGFGQDDPLAAASGDEAAWVELRGRTVHGFSFFGAPKRSAFLSKMSGHCRVSLPKRTTT